MESENAVAQGKWWSFGLWFVQAILAAAFLAAGGMKLFMTVEEFGSTGAKWAGDVPLALFRFIGVAEVLGAVGLVVPAATGIYPRLTPLAAAGLVMIQVLAASMHIARGDGMVAMNICFAGLAGLVGWGRRRST